MRTTTPPPADNHAVCLELISELGKLRDAMLEREAQSGELLANVSGDNAFSARNLVHYMTLRSTDLRQIQQKLSWLGLSSLGMQSPTCWPTSTKYWACYTGSRDRIGVTGLQKSPQAASAASACWTNTRSNF